MANPARKPQPDPQAASEPAAPGSGPPQLRPRVHLDSAETVIAQAPRANEPRRLQERVAAAFTARENTPLEKTLMRLIIIAAACVVVLSAVGQGGLLSGLVR